MTNQINKGNYERSLYLQGLKQLTNYRKQPLLNITQLNYKIPKDFILFEKDSPSVPKDAYNKTEFYNNLKKIYENYDKLYGPFQSNIGD